MTTRIWVGALLTVFVALTITAHVRWAARAGAADVPGEMAPNEFGVAESVHRTGLVDRSNPSSWSWGSTAVRANRVTTGGPAGRSRRHSPGASSRPPTAWPPCFASTMPAARPDADIATLEARREAFATVLERGVTRFLRTIPATADFEVIAVDDPYEFSTPAQFSNFRRCVRHSMPLTRAGSLDLRGARCALCRRLLGWPASESGRYVAGPRTGAPPPEGADVGYPLSSCSKG